MVNVLCVGIDNGSATVIASGGGMPYSYSWNTGSSQSSAIHIYKAEAAFLKLQHSQIGHRAW